VALLVVVTVSYIAVAPSYETEQDENTHGDNAENYARKRQLNVGFFNHLRKHFSPKDF